MDISVIIATYNRSAILGKTLALYSEQAYAKDRYETLVIDDGSTDSTSEVVRNIERTSSCSFRYFRQEKTGPAAARNLGIQQARGRFLLFTNDDMFPGGDLIEQHMSFLLQNPASAVLGYIEWSPELYVTDFMHYLAPNGPLFDFSAIRQPMDCGYKQFCTGNISLSSSWFSEVRFDEEFPYPAMEDIEIGYRLERKGLKIIFNRKAVAYHFHPVTTESFCRRMRQAGISTAALLRKHPQLKNALLPRRFWPFFLCPPLLKLFLVFEKINTNLYWRSVVVDSYLSGVRLGRRMT
jgi:glycosyltransferase involved in cell wall biosynthesis